MARYDSCVGTRLLSLLLLLLAWAAPAPAAVEIAFYSKDFAKSFPHGFVRLTGTVDSTGEVVDTNYGFTPFHLSLAILSGPVPGHIATMSPLYVSRSDRHFALPLSEEQYRTVIAIVEKWRAFPQPSYRLNSRNCVYFVAEVASALGLEATPPRQLIKKPKSFLIKVRQDNLALIEAWPGPVPAAPAAPVAIPAQ